MQMQHAGLKLRRIVLPQKNKSENGTVQVVYYHEECLKIALTQGDLNAIEIARELKRRRDKAKREAGKIREEGERLMCELYGDQKE